MIQTGNPYFPSRANDYGTIGEGKYVMRVCDMAESDRPREKLAAAGPSALSIAEIIAVIIETGTRKEEVMTMAGRIVREYGEKLLLSETNPLKLADSLGIPAVKASRIVASIELGRRYFSRKNGQASFITDASKAFGYLRGMGYLKQEQFRGVYLNSRFEVIREEVVSIGSLTTTIVHPREVLRPALEAGAAAFIMAHNHPSGSLEATVPDIETTKRIAEAAGLMGIELLDHLIIAGEHYKSIMKQVS
jgi:DNA repair protein RadC